MIIKGTLQDLSDRSKWIAIIGSRKASIQECYTAYTLAKRYVQEGFIIVSGLAVGIDGYAHKGALDGGGQTVAIVNTSHNEPIYPEQNRELAERILEQGCIIYPYETRSRGVHFINRLLERDILLAHLCPKIVAVKHQGMITGGTRYAVNEGKRLGKDVLRYDCDGQFHKNPPSMSSKLDWQFELNISACVEQLDRKGVHIVEP